MKADIVSAFWIFGVALLGLWAWRTLAGLAVDSDNLSGLGKAMMAISG
jgi:hypothetical protein